MASLDATTQPPASRAIVNRITSDDGSVTLTPPSGVGTVDLSAPGTGPFPSVPGVITGANSYNSSRSIYNLHPAQIAKTRAALGKGLAGSGLARFYCLGDSVTGGDLVSLSPSIGSYPARLEAALKTLGYTISGTGVVFMQTPLLTTADSRIALTGSWSANNYTSMGQASLSNAATAIFTSDVAGTSAIIYYLNFGGPWTYTVDGGAPVTVTPGADYTIKSTSVTGLANTTHVIAVTSGLIANPAGLIGFEVIGAAGISVTNMGKWGSTAANWAANTPNYVSQLLPQFNGLPTPDTCFICLGLNDAQQGEGTALYLADMMTLVAACQAKGADVILVAPFTPATPADAGTTFDIPTATWVAYMQQLFALADAENLPLLYLSERGGLWATADANGLMLPSHGAHCLPPGYASMAQGVLDVLQPF